MKRLADSILLYLLIGALVNVAVAWACVVHFHRVRPAIDYTTPRTPAWPAPVPANWPVPEESQVASVIGMSFLSARSRPDEKLGPVCVPPAQFGWYALHVQQSGWPMRSLAGRHYWPPERPRYDTNPRNPRPLELSIDSGILWPSDLWPSQRGSIVFFPIRPLALGFAVNAAFYGLAAGAAAGLWRYARGIIRQRRGLCRRCRYDISATAADSPCPECGKPVKRRAAGAA